MTKWRRGLIFGGLAAGAVLTLVLAASGAAQSGSSGTSTSGTSASGKVASDPSQLPAADASRGESIAATRCQGCHGPAGVSSQAEFPRLAGQQLSYLQFQLIVLRSGARPAGEMNEVAAGLSDQDIADLSAYFSAQQVGPAWSGQDAALAKQGAALFNQGDVSRRVIACAVCHGSQGQGYGAFGIATIRHQSPTYLINVLTEYRTVPDFHVPVANAMHSEVAPLSDTELQALAAYLAGM